MHAIGLLFPVGDDVLWNLALQTKKKSLFLTLNLIRDIYYPGNKRRTIRHKQSNEETKMSEKQYPPISQGTRVRSIKPKTPDNEWTEEARSRRRWGVEGIVVNHHDSHGLCYDVLHADGARGCYDPAELEPIPQNHSFMDIPRDKNYPANSVQCDDCGGHGCVTCDEKGWLTPSTHVRGRKCEREGCNKPLPPDHVAVYCSNECAYADAH